MTAKISPRSRNPYQLVIIAALGYFVDIYDLILFGIVRKASLLDLGVTETAITNTGIALLNWQMIGMLIGGILWGVLGDKKGRLSVLFGSILLYSLANILNGFVSSIPQYALMRLLAGIGLAGELGAGITLVSETMSKRNRGYGTMIVVVFGALGAVLAAMIGGEFHWRTSYFIGGGLGLLLLALRFGAYESGMFRQTREAGVQRGDFFALFRSRSLLKRYLACIAVGLPVWFTVGILIVLSPEFGKALSVSEPVVAGTAVMYCYVGLSIGDLLSGLISQLWKSRKKVTVMFIAANFVIIAAFLFSSNLPIGMFYILCLLLGAATGYWAIFVTIASEQFGTNLRATVTTTVPNFVRGAVVPITALFVLLKGELGIVNSALAVGTICTLLALWSIITLKETFDKDLDYVEEP